MGNTESTLPAEDQSDIENAHTNRSSSRQQSRRRHRRITLESASSANNDCPWWSKIENESLALDAAPNIAVELNDSEHAAAAAILAHDELDALLRKYEHVNVVARTASNVNLESDDIKKSINDQLDQVIATTNTIEAENPAQKQEVAAPAEQTNTRSHNSPSPPSTAREQSLEEFKEELRIKRLARQTAVLDLRDEITSLRQQLANEQALTRRLRGSECSAENANADDNVANEPAAIASDAVQFAVSADVDADDDDPLSRSRHANIALANVQLALQLSQAENLSLRTELGVVQKQVSTLKEVIVCCKQMLTVKEEQCTQLKSKLQEIEISFGEREMKIMSSNLRQEYERQLLNIRQLRQLYEERQRIAAAEQENLQRLISIKKDELQAEQEKTKNYEERNQTLVKEVENANIELATLREECNEHKFEKKALKEEMGAINTLFTQMVMGFNGKNNLDIDRLTAMLEENRTLLNEMTTKEANCSDGATLPKLLFELVEQAAVVDKISSRSPTPTIPALVSDAEHDNENENENDNENDDGVGDGESDAVAGAGADVDVGNDAACGTTAAEVVIAAEHGAVANVPMMDKNLTTQQNKNIADNAKDDEKQLLGAMALCNNDNNSTNNNSIDNLAASAATNNIKIFNKKHVRRTYGNKNKTLATVAAAAAVTTTASTKMLNFPDAEVMGKVASAQEIIGNLPKVWKVLMELLSHHKIEQVQFEENGTGEDCYKSVETANGPKAELSVSKTYIKLKDLILEKKSLMKETNRLKTLNSHLDYRLNEQEKRLSAVSLELTKTWHLVGKMQRQHRQLHTQEQILRYQLQQKRRLLSELKDELEYCRRKWAAARAKNDESQEQCNDLRREFAQRKLDDASHSAESGYSDSGPASDEEERNGVAAVAAAAAASAGTGNCASNVVSVVSAAYSGGATATSACSRRKHLKEMFEHTRKIKRMQSTSPGRAAGIVPTDNEEIVLRWNSAPPTCGWRSIDGADDDDVVVDDDNNEVDVDDADDVDDDDDGPLVSKTLGVLTTTNRGAIPKAVPHNSRSKQRTRTTTDIVGNVAGGVAANGNLCTTNAAPTVERATRIQRLEEQCKSLIQKVLETSDNRERLEIQLCHFQDEVAPVQYAMPLDELINRKRLDRMTRASSAPATGSLTPREEEYTRKRSERLERLEEESRQLMSRIKRTSDRGHYLRCSLDRIRRAPPHEDSCESNTEDELAKEDQVMERNVFDVQSATATSVVEPIVREQQLAVNKSPLTADEEAYTARRAARLERLEEESRNLLKTLARQTERGGSMDNKLDNLHERYGSPTSNGSTTIMTNKTTNNNVEKRLQNIEQISLNREERLRLLEEEGKALLSRLTNTSERGTQMINRIAERELNRQKRDSSTPNKDNTAGTQESPLLNNIACTSIVDETLTDAATVTTTSNEIATQQGAIPKSSKPQTELSVFARSKTTRQQEQQSDAKQVETLEDMVRRLKELPFPSDNEDSNEQPSTEDTNATATTTTFNPAASDTSNDATSSQSADQP